MTKTFLLLILIYFTNSIAQAQKIDLGTYDMEVIEVTQKKSITSIGQLMFPHKGNKYIGLKIILDPKSKGEKLLLDDLVLTYESKSSSFLLARGHAAQALGQGSYIKLKKAKKKTIYAEVSKTFTQGNLMYNGIVIGSIKTTQDSKTGTFTTEKM